MVLGKVQTLGRRVAESVEGFGRFVCFCGSTAAWTLRDLRRPRRWRLILPQLYVVGTLSIPVVMLTGAFIGMVLAIELFAQFSNFGQETKLGGVIGLSVVSHLGPVLAAVMLAGRVGGAFAAELGTMSVTEQVDALKVMGTSPVGYLVVPRVLACLVMIPIMTVFSDLTGVLGGWAITVGLFGVTNHEFWANSASFVGLYDISAGLAKGLMFGLAIGLVCCYKGFHCTAGAQGVGRATTDAFVTSFVAIIILNFFLAKFTSDLYHLIWGYTTFSPLG